MTRAAAIALAAALAWGIGTAGTTHAQACAGDCDEGGTVAINELIVCVNIASGTTPLSACEAGDVDGNGAIAINEIIAAVNAGLNGCEPSGGAICGNGSEEEDETCDDGNTRGGDGCAANCTIETRRETPLDPTRSRATVQVGPLPIPLMISGTQALIAGRPRDVPTIGPGNELLFAAGDIPLVTRAVDIRFNPVRIQGLACGCVRGIPDPIFGEGLSGAGVVGCGEPGLMNVNFRLEQDHNTAPGTGGNGGSATGLPDDPECDDVFDAGGGVRSEACLEGADEDCSEPENEHIDATAGGPACISPRVYTFSGGPAGRGAVLLRTSTAIGLLEDGGFCEERRLPNGACMFPDYGPDCQPCTDDDVEKGDANIGLTTSGTVEVVLHDYNNSAGMGFCVEPPCVSTVTGEPTDCDALEVDPNAPLTGVLVTGFPTIDAAMVGDTVTTTTLAAQNE